MSWKNRAYAQMRRSESGADSWPESTSGVCGTRSAKYRCVDAKGEPLSPQRLCRTDIRPSDSSRVPKRPPANSPCRQSFSVALLRTTFPLAISPRPMGQWRGLSLRGATLLSRDRQEAESAAGEFCNILSAGTCKTPRKSSGKSRFVAVLRRAPWTIFGPFFHLESQISPGKRRFTGRTRRSFVA